MLAEQRLENIMQIIKNQGFAEVDKLAGSLNVSEMTIRRDLQKLSEMGLILRKHGGASLLSSVQVENDYALKKSRNQEDKKKIAAKALSYIHNGDAVYLDGGTTTFEIASQLYLFKNLTVVTNDIVIAAELAKTDVEIIMVGGSIQKKTKTIIGQYAIDFIKQFHVTSVFLGTSSINQNFDVFSPTIEKAVLKKAVLGIAEQSFLVADASKFYGYSLNRFGNLYDFTGVITNMEFSDSECKKISNLKINMIIV